MTFADYVSFVYVQVGVSLIIIFILDIVLRKYITKARDVTKLMQKLVNEAKAILSDNTVHLKYEIVTALPTTNISTTTIYMVAKTTAEQGISAATSDVYTEYVYLNGKWEIIGDTTVDFSNAMVSRINAVSSGNASEASKELAEKSNDISSINPPDRDNTFWLYHDRTCARRINSSLPKEMPPIYDPYDDEFDTSYIPLHFNAHDAAIRIVVRDNVRNYQGSIIVRPDQMILVASRHRTVRSMGDGYFISADQLDGGLHNVILYNASIKNCSPRECVSIGSVVSINTICGPVDFYGFILSRTSACVVNNFILYNYMVSRIHQGLVADTVPQSIRVRGHAHQASKKMSTIYNIYIDDLEKDQCVYPLLYAMRCDYVSEMPEFTYLPPNIPYDMKVLEWCQVFEVTTQDDYQVMLAPFQRVPIYREGVGYITVEAQEINAGSDHLTINTDERIPAYTERVSRVAARVHSYRVLEDNGAASPILYALNGIMVYAITGWPNE